MPAPANLTRPWNYHSEVRTCATCDGLGIVPAPRLPSTWDPFPERPCPDCDGEHGPECAVCGFTLPIKGYDCLACDTVATLTDDDCAAFDIPAFADALAIAFVARSVAS